MIEQPAYSNNDLMQKIRKQYGTIGTVFEAAPDASGVLQSGIRSNSAESGESSEIVANSKPGTEGSEAGSARIIQSSEGSNFRERRTNTESAEGSGSPDSDQQSTLSEIQPTPAVKQSKFFEAIKIYWQAKPDISARQAAKLAGCSVPVASKILKELRADDEKPAGLAPQPNPREQQARAEKQQSEQASSGSKNLFSWVKAASPGAKTKEPGGKTFTEQEAEKARDPLKNALADYFKYMDELIYATNKKHIRVDIWSSIDDEDLYSMVDIWLARAKRSSRVASQVRKAINVHNQLKVGLILAPRFYQTWKVYAENGIGIK